MDTIGTANVCPEYEGICNSGASSILLVGVVMCSQVVGYEEATFSDLSIAKMLRKASAKSNNVNIDLLRLCAISGGFKDWALLTGSTR